MDELQTQRLLLRPFAAGDAAFILELLNEPSFLEHIGDKGVRNLEQALAYLEQGPLESYRRHGLGLLAVVRRDSGELIGMCGLLKRDHLDAPDLGYAFLPRAWSQGFALEAAQGVMAQAEGARRLRRLWAVVSPLNSKSIRLLEKVGFQAAPEARQDPAATDTVLFEWRGDGA